MGVRGDEDVDALRREVVALRSKVAELQRASARYEETSEISLSEREELLREAEGSAHLGTWMWDISSGRVHWSPEMYRILGYEIGSVTPSVELFFSMVHPEDRARAQAVAEQGIREGVLPHVDCRIIRPDGEVRHTTSSGIYLFDTEGKPRRMVGGVLDRTESLEAQVALQRTLSLLEEAQRLAKLGSWRFDVSTGELEWSKEFRRIAGLPEDVVPNAELFFERVVPEDRERFRANHHRALSSPRSADRDVEGRLQRSDGEVREVRLKGMVFERPDGRVEMRGTMLDTTDQARMREELAHAQKMEAVGRLAGGIAHDFNNMLTIVAGNLELLSLRIGGAPELAECRRALDSAANLTQRLLAFGRKAPLSLRLTDLNHLVRSTTALMKRLVGDEIRLVIDLGADVPAVNVDPLEVERALVNLVVNARDVMPNGGSVYITTTTVDEGSERVVELSVADEGPGIDEVHRPHVFEPFYTTRADSGGTGLGLATVLGTAEQHGGTVRLDSTASGGARFTMVLPAAAGDVSVQQPPERSDLPRTSQTRRLTILVVDDEPLVAEVARRHLEACGHAVWACSDPDEALSAWPERGATIDAVVCDVVMSGMRGPELVARLGKVGPAPRVLFITGYSEEAAQAELNHPVLKKPFTQAGLVAALEEIVAAAR